MTHFEDRGVMHGGWVEATWVDVTAEYLDELYEEIAQLRRIVAELLAQQIQPSSRSLR